MLELSIHGEMLKQLNVNKEDVMNQKGFTIIELLIVILIIGIFTSVAIPSFFEWAKEEKIAQQAGNLIKEFKEESEPKVITNNVVIDKLGVSCQDGQKIIELDGVIYHLGTIKNTWGDLAPVECQ